MAAQPGIRVLTLPIALGWLAGAVWLGALGTLERWPRPAIQGILAVLTLALLAAALATAGGRAWVRRQSPTLLVAIHVLRILAGASFLIKHARGELPGEFAVPAGVGDIIVGALAVGLLCLGRRLEMAPSAGVRRAILGWNILGLCDILLVVLNAGRMGIKDPMSMVELARMPLCLLPLVLVPLVITSHVLIFVRLARGKQG